MRLISSVVAAGLLLAAASAVQAAVISVNFHGQNQWGGYGSDVTQTAGVIPVANWNNVPDNSAAPSPLINDAGVSVTGTSMTYTSGGSWRLGTNLSGTPTGNEQLMQGYIDGGVTFTVAGLNYPNYSLVVYYNKENWPGTLSGTVGSTTYTGTAQGGWSGTFTQGIDGNSSNYFRFDNLSGSSVTFTGVNGSFGAGVNGFQIAGVPEPTSMLVLAGAGMLMMGRRRSAKN